MKLKDLKPGSFARLGRSPLVVRVGAFCKANQEVEIEDVTDQVLAAMGNMENAGRIEEQVFDIATLTAATLEATDNVKEFGGILHEINDDIGGRLGLYQLCFQAARYLDMYRREFETEDYPGVFEYEVPWRFWSAWCEETDQMFRAEWQEKGLRSGGWPASAVADRTSEATLERIARTVVRLWFHPPTQWKVVTSAGSFLLVANSFKEAYSAAVHKWDVGSILSIWKES